VDLLYDVKPDLELYITEYAAIRIVFTLQGLYKLYLLAPNLARSDLTISKAPV